MNPHINPRKEENTSKKRTMSELKISDFMTMHPYTIEQDQSLSLAHQIMRENHIRHLPVLCAGRLVGLLSQRDLYLVETLKDVDPSVVTVAEAMTEVLMTVSPEDMLQGVAEEMAEKKYGSAVVMKSGAVVGIFTTIDALRALSETLKK